MTVLLLHAFPLDERMWEPQKPVAPDAVAPRLYGRGPTMDAWSHSIAKDVDGEVVLVGASMGGYCALAFARHFPERVRGVLLAGSRPDADSDERRAGRAKTIQLVREQGPDGLWNEMVPKLFADRANADERLLHRDADHLIGALEAIRDRDDSTDVARALGNRLRFIVGEHEQFVTVGDLAEFDIREIGGGGHLVNLERPDEFNSHLEEFLGGL